MKLQNERMWCIICWTYDNVKENMESVQCRASLGRKKILCSDTTVVYSISDWAAEMNSCTKALAVSDDNTEILRAVYARTLLKAGVTSNRNA